MALHCLKSYLYPWRFNVVTARNTGGECEYPELLIGVITLNRTESLRRLLASLVHSDFACTKPDIVIFIDKPSHAPVDGGVLDLATNFVWPYGAKFVRRGFVHRGLSKSWFELSHSSKHEYIAVFEDDMEVNPRFFSFFALLHKLGALSAPHISGLCLHPNFWELPITKDCTNTKFSRYLFESPEPCNWGPIWKVEEWTKFSNWVATLHNQGKLPYVEPEYALNWNLYLDQGKDVQSSWVWKYNRMKSKRQIRYTFKSCDAKFTSEVYFSINHKEPGEHFKFKYNLENDPALLSFDYKHVYQALMSHENSFKAQVFDGYETIRNMKSMRG